MAKDGHEWTPLHWASFCGYSNIVQYLVIEANCDPSCKNSNGSTPLHLASLYVHTDIVQFLLSTARVDPLALDLFDETPMGYADNPCNAKSFDILKLYQPFEQCRRDFPVHTYTKLILTGCSGAGKTTMCHLILRLLSVDDKQPLVTIKDVERLTAGIVPLQVVSNQEDISNMVVFDFAGHQDYYSSHAAVLERCINHQLYLFAL